MVPPWLRIYFYLLNLVPSMFKSWLRPWSLHNHAINSELFLIYEVFHFWTLSTISSAGISSSSQSNSFITTQSNSFITKLTSVLLVVLFDVHFYNYFSSITMSLMIILFSANWIIQCISSIFVISNNFHDFAFIIYRFLLLASGTCLWCNALVVFIYFIKYRVYLIELFYLCDLLMFI